MEKYQRYKLKYKDIPFAFFDFETFLEGEDIDKKHVVYVISLYSPKETIVWVLNEEGSTTLLNRKNIFFSKNPIDDFVNYVVNNYANYKLYAHNMDDFDGVLLCEKIQTKYLKSKTSISLEGNKVSLIKLKNNIEIKDSYKLLHSGLNELAIDFKLNSQKIPFNIKKITKTNYKEHLIEIIDYCINDSKLGFEILKLFVDLVKTYSTVNPLNCISLSQFAWRTFRKDYFDLCTNLYKLTLSAYQFISNAQLGGRVDFQYLYTNKDVFHYDVNALYAFIISSLSLAWPVGEPKYITLDRREIYTFFGFVEVTVETSDSNLPILPYRLANGEVIYPKGIFRGIYFSEILKYALKHGYKLVKVHKAVSFDKGFGLFSEFATTFTKLKEANALDKGPLYQIAKMIPNSLIGKLGQKDHTTKTIILQPAEYDDWMYSHQEMEPRELSLSDGSSLVVYNPKISIKDTKDPIILLEKLIEQEASYNFSTLYPINLAAAITSYAQIYLYEAILKTGIENFVMCDTDSIWTTKPFPAELVDSIKTGSWKLEGKYKELYVYGPKMYFAIHENINKNKATFVGVRKEQQNFIANSFAQQIKQGKKLENIKVKIKEDDYFRKSNKEFSIKYHQIEKELRITAFNKRVIFDNSLKTLPLEIKNEKINKN